MKKRIMDLMAGMVLVAVSASFSQAADMNKNEDRYILNNAADETPAIVRSIDVANYQPMNKESMQSVEGEVIPLVPILVIDATGYLAAKLIWDVSHKRGYDPLGKW